MTALYTIELVPHDGRPSLWAHPKPHGWSPEFDCLLTSQASRAALLGDAQVQQWLRASTKALVNARAKVRLATREQVKAQAVGEAA